MQPPKGNPSCTAWIMNLAMVNKALRCEDWLFCLWNFASSSSRQYQCTEKSNWVLAEPNALHYFLVILRRINIKLPKAILAKPFVVLFFPVSYQIKFEKCHFSKFFIHSFIFWSLCVSSVIIYYPCGCGVQRWYGIELKMKKNALNNNRKVYCEQKKFRKAIIHLKNQCHCHFSISESISMYLLFVPLFVQTFIIRFLLQHLKWEKTE